jgi:hypothetical protein
MHGQISRTGEMRNASKILCAFLVSPIHATRPAHHSFLVLITVIIFGEAYKL